MTLTYRQKKKRPWRPALMVCVALVAAAISRGNQADASAGSPTPVGPRVLELQTQRGVTRDYLQAWKSLGSAMEENRADLLDASFVGPAREKLVEAIREQQELDVKTRYQVTGHNLNIVFYSPEGLSIELEDTVDYDVQIVDHGKALQIQHVHSRYVAVLTPTEVQWKVRMLEAAPVLVD